VRERTIVMKSWKIIATALLIAEASFFAGVSACRALPDHLMAHLR
jgi:hypothetical protein